MCVPYQEKSVREQRPNCNKRTVFAGRDKSAFFPAHPREKKSGCEDTSLLSDHLGEARTKFVGGLNITPRDGFGRPPLPIPLFPLLASRGVSSAGHCEGAWPAIPGVRPGG